MSFDKSPKNPEIRLANRTFDTGLAFCGRSDVIGCQGYVFSAYARFSSVCNKRAIATEQLT